MGVKFNERVKIREFKKNDPPLKLEDSTSLELAPESSAVPQRVAPVKRSPQPKIHSKPQAISQVKTQNSYLWLWIAIFLIIAVVGLWLWRRTKSKT